MSILEALGDHIQANNLGTLGTDLFLGRMPASPDVCVTVFEMQGSAPIETLRDGGYSISLPRIQVMTRATREDYPTGRDRAAAIRDLLAGMVAVTVSGVTILRVRSLGDVAPAGYDDLDRPRFLATFDAWVSK